MSVYGPFTRFQIFLSGVNSMRQDRQAEHRMCEDAVFAVVAEDACGDLNELLCAFGGRFEQQGLLSVFLEPPMQVAHCKPLSARMAITGGNG